ncbi:NADPH oxidase 4 isoform X1 [Canis lupus baileyi]|uniref:NADPH oxidase 4 n=4 Tax=Canidae TaxID=9608 RepID=A0A8C0NFI8_CANLF|nr:NADPH oxidase 4 isoform X1 [Canis lupus dingo]XP_038285735.1 NADPH oxidase 4 isoform X1 [Canis lupus familiaris]XP_038312131.1 NADPH oxidase 4 isoform X1 [Canis lupus familiaris]XP_038424277.1 NADPH oxidase 4 isoform X1 [Canis lupus familiaris]
MAVSWRSWLANEGVKHLCLFIWLSLNVLLFWKAFLLYNQGPEYHYLHQMLGLGLCLSRASASVLNLNCSLILLPMCRTLLAYLRGSQKVPSRRTRRLLDKSRTFHITCGVTICIFSGVHVAAHLVNALNFSVNYNEDFTELNAARYRDEDPRKLLFTTVPGLTGVGMVLVLFLMITASTYAIRVSNYDIFWYTHNLFFVFYMLLMLHVSGGLLKYQANLDTHPPGCININGTRYQNIHLPNYRSEHFHESFPGGLSKPDELTQNRSVNICMEEPRFQANFPQTWLWISGPLCLYCAERLYRCIRSNKPVTIISVISHPSDVMEIRMIKENFKARPGQYIILHCPSVSALENHPFTLTMCPTETKATFGVHLKIVGDWTERFRDLLLPPSNQDSEILPVIQSRKYPKLYIDGPFGSPFEESLNYEVSLCVAGGIGVTPFASILNTLLDDWKPYKLRRLYFIWVCRDIQSFRWFADLLCVLHNKFWQENRPDYVNIQLYLSQTDGIQKIIGEKYQALNSRLFIGRPRWKLLFDEIAKCNRGKTVGVFCCGPNSISKTLHKLSNRNNSYGTRFEYNKESFS